MSNDISDILVELDKYNIDDMISETNNLLTNLDDKLSEPGNKDSISKFREF